MAPASDINNIENDELDNTNEIIADNESELMDDSDTEVSGDTENISSDNVLEEPNIPEPPTEENTAIEEIHVESDDYTPPVENPVEIIAESAVKENQEPEMSETQEDIPVDNQ